MRPGLSRNGHKLTHASKKPHGCHFCDKSYSDARSLSRHYENAHPDEYEAWRLLSRAAEQQQEEAGCDGDGGGADGASTDSKMAVAAMAPVILQLSNAAVSASGGAGAGRSQSGSSAAAAATAVAAAMVAASNGERRDWFFSIESL